MNNKGIISIMGESLIYISPSIVALPRDGDDVRRFLQYRDRSAEYQIYRLKNEQRYRKASGWVDQKIDELKSQIIKTAVWEEDGMLVTYSGLAKDLSNHFKWEVDSSALSIPEPKLLPWRSPPKFSMWKHQQEAFDAAIKVNHAGIELPTGSGKSRVILELVKHFGLKTLIATPSAEISKQLFEEFKERFGERYVGMYGAGKKKSGKLITISVAQALVRLDPESEDFKALSKSDIFMFDEAHTCPADTFEKVCMGVAKNATRRYFMSATHTRTDGSDIILKGITGPIVYRQTFYDMVEKQILAKPVWKMFCVAPASAASFNDPNKETRANLYKNPHVNNFAADVANKAVTIANRPTVIIIQEFSQFVRLYPLIKVPFVFAHGGIPTKHDDQDLVAALSAIPDQYKKMDASDAIEKFNSGEVKLLIGTSAISTGVDLRPTQCLIYLQGGTSEIKVKQAIGRGTRMGVPGKKDFWVVDFIVSGSKTLTRHALSRKKMYEEMMGEVDIIGDYVKNNEN